MRECFCFGSEAVNASGEAVRGRVELRISRGLRPRGNMAASPPFARSRISPATQAKTTIAKLKRPLFKYLRQLSMSTSKVKG